MSRNPQDSVFCALDTGDLGRAISIASAIKPWVGGLKVGLEFFTANGPEGFHKVSELGLPIFLDLKFHDIPNTVAGAVRSAAQLGPCIINVHASGGEAMMKAAHEAAQQIEDMGKKRPMIVAVTVLTSLDQRDISKTGPSHRVSDQVKKLATLAQKCQMDGVVCSAQEISTIRDECGDEFLLVVPGLRPPWVQGDDQKRVMSPEQAWNLGADVLVIGRPITQSDDPADTARRILRDIAGHPDADEPTKRIALHS